MNNLERAQRDWETPPDEEEARYCEECNEELEWKPDYVGNTPMTSGNWECTNPYCPDKFTTISSACVVVDMANYLVEVEEKLKSTQDSLRYARHKLSVVQDKLKEREETIEELEKEIEVCGKIIDNLYETPDQRVQVVLRDTDYQIRRMEDAIELAYIDCGLNGEGYRVLKLEWNEVKKILTNL